MHVPDFFGVVANPMLIALIQQLVEPINQTVETDTVIPGLCAFVLGTCYEFNREPGEVTR